MAHHLESIRDAHSDYAAIPLCDWHHKELHSLSRRGFEARYQLTPIDLLALTIKLLQGGKPMHSKTRAELTDANEGKP